MVLSFSRPDPSSPMAVAGASFTPSRRGYDQDEVRDFLRMVSAELTRLQERVVFLERELADRPHGGATFHPEITEDTVAELLGEETARIVQTAREAAHKIKVRSEESAAKLIREASEEAARLREEAELDCARRRQDATSDAEAEVLMAKQQGRDMVNEARAYRERVLADVARRREMAREQLEDLFHGRDRLVQAFERARTATEDVLRDVSESSDEPTEFINLAPTTGPVPVIVQADEVERTEAIRPATSSAPSYVPYDQDEDRSADIVRPAAPIMAPREHVPPIADTARDAVDSALDDADLDDTAVDDADLDDDVVSELEAPPASPPTSNVVPLFARTDPEPAPGGSAVTGEPEDAPIITQKSAVASADDIFARLRRSSTDIVAKDAAMKVAKEHGAETPREVVARVAEATTPRAVTPVRTDTECFATRQEVLVPIILDMSRKIKRVLADEQNQILDTLRGKQPVKTLEALAGSKAEHGARFIKALDSLLNSAAMAGASTLSDRPKAELAQRIEGRRHDIDESVVATIVAPLRERLSRSISQASGSNAELASLVRSIYREWKNQFVDEHVDDLGLTAHGLGARAVLEESLTYCWMVDPDGPACSDAEDNSLAGAVAGGAEFPTGHTHAPAHPGCRCALIPCDN
ncbi:MAG: DivIVA domain-containing protein [Actinomycetota bacterium]